MIPLSNQTSNQISNAPLRLSAFTDILPLDFEESLDALASVGLKVVDLRSKIGPDTVDSLSPERALRVREALEKRGLSCGCVATWGVNPLKGGYDPLDPAYRAAMRDRVSQLSVLAHTLDCPTIRVLSFQRAPEGVSQAQRADNAAFLSELAEIAAQFDRVLLVENDVTTRTATAPELADLMARDVPSNLKLNWDIVNSWRAGEVPWHEGLVEQIGSHIAHIHVKGACGDANENFVSMAVPGRDELPHETIFRRLWVHGFRGIVTIDPHYNQFAPANRLDDLENPVLEVVRQTITFLKPIFERLAQEPQVRPMRLGEVPCEAYAHGGLHWLSSRAANGARELTLGRTTIAPGGANPLHRHPNCEEVLYVLAGEVEHHVAGTPDVRVKAGEAILIPRDAIHQARNCGAAPAELLVTFSSADRETILVTTPSITAS